MTNLVGAYQRKDIKDFEKILKDHRSTIMEDPFIKNYIDDVLKNIRTQVIVKLIKPYSRIEIKFISKVYYYILVFIESSDLFWLAIECA